MNSTTISDVARRAGVSKRTVSRVINESEAVRDTTRKKVLRVIEELNYSPNILAQKLARGETGIIGVFVYEPMFPTEREDFFYPFLEGIEKGAENAGYDLLLYTQKSNTEKRSVFSSDRARAYLSDGLIIMGGTPNRDDLYRMKQENIPFVCIGRREIVGASLSWVNPDYEDIYYRITRYLIDRGHRKIGYIDANSKSESSVDKITGYRRALSESGLSELEYGLFLQESALSLNYFYREGVTALLVLLPDRSVTNKIYTGIRELGLKIPKDMSLVVFDEINSRKDIQLSYVQMPKRFIAQKAVKLLVEKFQNDEYGAKEVFVPCRFIEGNSVASV